MLSPYDVAARFSRIRPMLEKRIKNADHIIGTFVVTICFLIGDGSTDDEIVNTVAGYGEPV